MRKIRTRQHIIEDLSINHVEKQVLLAGYSTERYFSDYGIDLLTTTYNENGEVERGVLFFQVKATDHLKISKKHDKIEFTLSKRDLEFWLSELYLVFLIVYDAQKDIAYYLNLQQYFKENRIELRNVKKYKNVFIPKTNVFNKKVVIQLRDLKNSIR